MGHLVRCRALAAALKKRGEDCLMIGPAAQFAGPGDSHIFSEWLPDTQWRSSEDDASKVLAIAGRTGASWVVLDDYRIDEQYQLMLKAAGLHLLHFDGGSSQPLWADIVVDASPGASSERFKTRMRNAHGRLMLGPRHAVLRAGFPPGDIRQSGRPVEQVLVMFGGGDDRGAIQFVLSALLPATHAGIKFLVISGASNPRNGDLQKWVVDHGQGRVKLAIDPDPIAPLFTECELALIAGGTSTYEAACSGLPMVIVTIAENQIDQAESWARSGAALYVGPLDGVTAEELQSEIGRLIADDARRARMSDIGRDLADGRGAERLARAMIDYPERRT